MTNHHREHIPTLDGLRGMAILMVLIAHFNGEAILKEFYPLMGPVLTKVALSGLHGVDLFFVLSGFLITRILIDTKESPKYFLNFYARRFLRIFPLYYGVLFLIFGILPLIVTFDLAASELSSKQWWLWAYLSNFPGSNMQWDSSNIFKLGHFWSLAVEEHFYIVWPVVILFCGLSRLKKISILLVCVSFSIGLISAFLDNPSLWLINWSTVNHIGGLALGSLCALTLHEKGNFKGIVPWAKIGLLVFGFLFLLLAFIPRQYFLWIVIRTKIIVSSFLFVSLLILAVEALPNSLIGRFLTNRIMTRFGQVSYGLYVYHGILRPLFDQIFPRETLIALLHSPALGIVAYFVLAIGSSFLISLFSWHLYEKQFLKLKKYFAYEKREIRSKEVSISLVQD